jgi:hypothetical protein
MAENLGSYAVNLPKIFQSPGEALQALSAKKERDLERQEAANFRNQQAEERKAKELEAERQRGMAMIQSGARLDRMPADEQAYMVAQDAVSKVKSNLMAKLNNKSIDPIALQTEIDDVMKGITRASNTFILEHNNIDEIVNQYAKNYPSIDAAALKNDLRSDVRNRRIKEGQFVDPNQVEDSALIAQLSNPENLSKYITEYNTLDKVISGKESSRNIEAKLGTPQAYTTFSGKMGFWNKPTFEVEPSGFIKKGGKIPSLTYGGVEIANEPLPANSLRGVDKPLDMVPQVAYDKFLTEGGNNAKSEIVSLAQKQFTPEQYKTFSPQEKDFANRNALYNYLKKKDTQGFVGLSETSYNPPPSYAGQKSTEGERKAGKIGEYLDTFTQAIKSNNVDSIKALAGKLYGLGGGKSRFSKIEVYKRPDGVVTGVQLKYADSKGKIIGGDIIKATDPYLRDKLQGSYQQISGSESAAEIENLPNLNQASPKVKEPIATKQPSATKEPSATSEEIKKFRAGGDKAPNVKVYLVSGKSLGMSDQIYDYDDLVEGGWTDADIKKLKSLNTEEVKRFRIAENKK